jgi:hypothetical protein
MDQLKETIQCLTAKEIKLFKLELQKTSRSKEIVKLLDAYYSDEEYKKGELSKKIYGADGEARFHAARRRLNDQLLEFLIELHNDGDKEIEAQINDTVALATIMVRRKNFAVAEEQLSIAEELAERTHHYELLARIYRLQLSHPSWLVNDVQALCQRATRNLERYSLVTQLNIAFAQIRDRMETLRGEGKHFDTAATIRQTLQELNFNQRSMLTNPVFMLRLLELVRTVVASGKDYAQFKPYLLKAYHLLVRANAFTGYNAPLEADFLYMITHVHYRTREFDIARHWMEKLKRLLYNPEEQQHYLYIKSMTMEAGIMFFTKQLQPAIDKLRFHLDDTTIRCTRLEKMNIRLNLAVYLFFAREYKSANRISLQLPVRSKALESEFGKEWFFKRDLIEVIFQYELGNSEHARNRLLSIPREYNSMLQESNYKRALVFIGFMLKYFDDPEYVRSEEFRNTVLAARIGWEGQSEDIQAILFFCWLRSKMQSRDCYEVVLERVDEGVDMLSD